jgi:hypothetical protein
LIHGILENMSPAHKPVSSCVSLRLERRNMQWLHSLCGKYILGDEIVDVNICIYFVVGEARSLRLWAEEAKEVLIQV